jgi:hypothetical protein
MSSIRVSGGVKAGVAVRKKCFGIMPFSAAFDEVHAMNSRERAEASASV